MKLKFCRENIGNEFPVLWEGYSEPYAEGKQLVFGYTPNYLKVGCVISNELSVENQTINCKVTAAGTDYVFGVLVE
jgi:threonylcarbamoyladenosine tRNA methylthiotransferase MtaB